MTCARDGRARPRIIGISVNIDGTGLTRVMRAVLGRLTADFGVDYLGIGYAGPAAEAGGVLAHPVNQRGGDVFAAFQALEMIRAAPPEGVLVLHDIWLFRHYERVFAPVRDRTRFIGYVPLDGDITDESVALPLRGLDRVVVYTGWAADQLSGAFDRLRAARLGAGLPRIEVIPHGVDAATFAARPELLAAGFDPRGRADVKRRVFPGLPDPEDSFIILNANRPAARKRVDITIEAFAMFAAGKPPGVRLCLHQAITEEDTADLLALARKLGIEDRLLYNPLSPGGVLADDDLALLYSACDIGINTSMGEGWGLVSFEHAATGAAQIVPGHSACADLWRHGTAVLVKPAERGIPSFSPLELARVDPAGAAAAMEALYRDRDRLRQVSRAGYDYVRRPELRWEAIGDRWRALLGEVAGRRS